MIRILATATQKQHLLTKGIVDDAVVWVEDLDSLLNHPADAYLDLLFTPTAARITALKQMFPKPVLIHAVSDTIKTLGHPFVRINAWPGFLERSIAECAVPTPFNAAVLEPVAQALKWQFIMLPDEPGFIAGKVLASIINESYLALEEGVSSKEEIDLAMQTGTSYPSGPFEWASRIGLPEVLRLLELLAKNDRRYQPATLLLEESGLISLQTSKANGSDS